MILKAKKKN